MKTITFQCIVSSLYLLLFVTVCSNGLRDDLNDAEFECLNFVADPVSNIIKADAAFQRYGSKTTYLKAREYIRYTYNISWSFDRTQYEPVSLFFFSRHTIRYPSEKEIGKFSSNMPDAAKLFLANPNLKTELRTELTNWRLLMHPTEENRVSISGRFETAIQARIFYKYFPELLDVDNNDFEVGVSSKIRTTETAQAFLRGLVEFQLRKKGKNFEESSQAIQDFLDNHFSIKEDDVTMAHNRCKKVANKPKKMPDECDRLMKSTAIDKLVKAFQKRHALPESFSYSKIAMLWKMCVYELANFRYSPWCHFFNEMEKKAIEYQHDWIDHYDAYGHEPHRQIACVVIKKLYEKLVGIIKRGEKPKTTLLFSHEHLVNKLAAFLGLFEQFPVYETDEDDNLCLPIDPQRWLSSFVMPFNANFAAVLFKRNDEYKLLTLFNEVPVAIRGCDSELCDVRQFMRHYENIEETCDPDVICPVEKKGN